MDRLPRFLFGTFRGRLILSVALVHAVMMSLFIIDLTARQDDMLLDRQVDEATALSQVLATSAAGWIAADDVAGLQELVDAQRSNPDVVFVVLTDEEGRDLADTDVSRQGQFLLDLPAGGSLTVMSRTPALVDVAAPAMIGDRQVGWARVGVGQIASGDRRAEIVRNGVLYALVAILIGSIIAWFMGRRITGRLYAVQETIDAVRSGDRGARSTLTGSDEAAAMAREFNGMLDALDERDAELRVSEERYRSLIEKVQAAIVVHDADGRVLQSNPLARQILGLTEDELRGLSLVDPAWRLVREDGSDMAVADYPASRVIATREPLRDEVVGIRHPGREDVTWALVNAEPELDDAGAVARLVVSFIEITERKRAEQALREQHSTLRGIIDGVPALVFSVDGHYRYTSFNQGHAAVMREIYGAEIELGRSMLDSMTVDEDRETARHNLDRALAGEQLVEEAFSGEEIRSRQYFRVSHSPIRSADGEVIGVAVLAVDLSERRRLEEQLRQSQKMEAIGRLAGGIAHDFNNLLTAIKGYAELVEIDMAADDPRRADVDEIRGAATRAAALTRQLLAFSRRQVLQPVVLDVDEVVAGLAPMLRRLLGERIELRTVATPGLGHVRADPSGLDQVILNLVVNARDAMPAGGVLTVETADVDLDADYVLTHPAAVPGAYVRIAVSDTGVGMEPATMGHLFEPFFTTKPAGEGTGLGLATAYGIVTQSGGHIAAYSEPGSGSTFRVYLPRVDEVVAPRADRHAAPAVGGSEAILLVEDDAAVRAFTERVLASLGYAVMAAPSGAAALEISASRPGAIDLLISDVMLPGMSSSELVRSLRASRPATRVLFVSGYAEDVIRGGVLGAGVAFLSKPFTADEIARKVREVLDAPRVAAV